MIYVSAGVVRNISTVAGAMLKANSKKVRNNEY